MPKTRLLPALLTLSMSVTLTSLAVRQAAAADAVSAVHEPTVSSQELAKIRDMALADDWAWQHLQQLADTIGGRLSGSPQLAAAVEQIASSARATGAHVTLQPVVVPHWVRGEETGEIVDFPGKAVGITQALHLTALGGSAATPPGGLVAPVLVVHDLDELRARGTESRGKLVLFVSRFDQRLAENGAALQAYRLAGEPRFEGPALAQSLGALGALVRSAGGANYRLPHTGGTDWDANQQSHIPAAAVAAEDADLIERLARTGQVSVRLLLSPHTLPEAESHNVIADWPGRERPDEYVIVSGHLDSWDLGTGAIDDGVGVISAEAVLEILNRLNLHPRRTIRFVAWTNEENGERGAKAYAQSVADRMSGQFAAIESDLGGGAALGITAAITPDSVTLLRPVAHTLASIGAPIIQRENAEVGSDIGGLQAAGVPGFAPLVDTRHYFDYHHSAADTLDKLDPANVRAQVATLAVLAYYLAQMPTALPRFKPDP
jgi:carboxypeptidase Q